MLSFNLNSSLEERDFSLSPSDSDPLPSMKIDSSMSSLQLRIPGGSSPLDFSDGSKLFLFPQGSPVSNSPANKQHSITIQTYDGKSCVLFLDETWTTQDLRRKIQNRFTSSQLDVSQSRIFYNGFELPEKLIVCSIVTPYSTLLLLPTISELVSFFLVSVSRRTSLVTNAETSIKELKDDVCQLMGLSGDVSEKTVIKWNRKELKDDQSMRSCGIERTTQLCIIVRDSDQVLSEPYRQRIENNDICTMIRKVESGMKSGIKPELIEDCTGGTYIVKDAQGSHVGIFKPVDEEPYAPGNPKGYIGDSMYVQSQMKNGIPVGESGIRECIAYLLDRDSFAGVPHTVILRILDTNYSSGQLHLNFKSGSFQRFISNATSADDFGPASFPVRDVHRIGILDIRLVNTDRHTGNILISRNEDNQMKLIPIDHAYILPDYRCLEEVNHEWLFWPQAKQPFGEEELKFIESLDPQADAAMVTASYDLKKTYVLTLLIGTILLKTGARRGLNLHQIGTFFMRKGNSASPIEKLISQVQKELELNTLESKDVDPIDQLSFPSQDKPHQSTSNWGAADDVDDVQFNVLFSSLFCRLLEKHLDDHFLQKPLSG